MIGESVAVLLSKFFETGGANDIGELSIFSPYASMFLFVSGVVVELAGLETPNSIGLNAISSSKISGSLSNNGFTSFSFSAIGSAFVCSDKSVLKVIFSSYSILFASSLSY